MTVPGQFDDNVDKIHKDMHDSAWLAELYSTNDEEFHRFAKAHHDARAKYEEITGKSSTISVDNTSEPMCSHCGEMF